MVVQSISYNSKSNIGYFLKVNLDVNSVVLTCGENVCLSGLLSMTWMAAKLATEPQMETTERPTPFKQKE